MKNQPAINFSVDRDQNKIIVIREFLAPVSRVWEAWTRSELLDQWWAPKPWRAQTKEMNFREGGQWLYVMMGTHGEEHWAKLEFTTIDPPHSFTGTDAFCDKDGNGKIDLPQSTWMVDFHEFSSGRTRTTITSQFEETSDMDTILEMGFLEGFNASLHNLDELLQWKQGSPTS